MADGYKVFDPNAEVIGRSMLSNFQNLHRDNFIPILHKHGIDEIDPAGWYSQQKWLDILKEVTEASGDELFDLVAVGMAIAGLAPFPPEIDTVKKAFVALDKVYQGNHRNGNVGELTCERSDDKSVYVRMNSPYPNNFLYGVGYGIAKRFTPPGSPPKVTDNIVDGVYYLTINW